MLYIAGAQDSKYSAIAHRLNRAESGLTVKIIPNASHAVLEESPDQLVSFLPYFHNFFLGLSFLCFAHAFLTLSHLVVCNTSVHFF